MSHSDPILPLLAQFRPLFTAPTWKKMMTLLTGTLLARGRRTVTAAVWQTGHLASMATRATFLSDPSHHIRFVYTPKHSSWLNQIEIWFSILVRRLLARLSCLSVQELRVRILAFIAYSNRTSHGAFHWTYKGPPTSA